jgi:hypothetical protein
LHISIAATGLAMWVVWTFTFCLCCVLHHLRPSRFFPFLHLYHLYDFLLFDVFFFPMSFYVLIKISFFI